MNSRSSSSRRALSIDEAVGGSAPLSRLVEIARRSRQCLDETANFIPAGLRASVKAGPLDGGQWCLIAPHNAAAAKLRQLVPGMLAHLRTRGWEITAIRVKVQGSD